MADPCRAGDAGAVAVSDERPKTILDSHEEQIRRELGPTPTSLDVLVKICAELRTLRVLARASMQQAPFNPEEPMFDEARLRRERAI